METTQLIVSPAPHIRARYSTAGIMWTVVTALLPAAVAGVVLFGRPALVVIISSILAAVLAEALSQLAMGRRITAHDGSAVVTGLLLALSVPPELPWWMAAFGAAFAIIIAKQVFGGLGHNVFNPALAGRAFLLASWPSAMMTWKWPAGSLSWAGGSADAVAGATVLEMAKRGLFARYGISIPYSQLFMGNIAGSLGETSALALLIGAVFLLAFRVIDWRIPLGYLGTLAALALLAGQDPVLHLLSGGVLLGALHGHRLCDHTGDPGRALLFRFGLWGVNLLDPALRRVSRGCDLCHPADERGCALVGEGDNSQTLWGGAGKWLKKTMANCGWCWC